MATTETRMKIEAGKSYIDRRGSRVDIVREMCTDEAHRFLGVTIEASGLESHDTWDEAGRSHPDGRYSSWDIVGVWS